MMQKTMQGQCYVGEKSTLGENYCTHHYHTYINTYLLLHMSVLGPASVLLTLVRFTLINGAGVPKNYAL